MKARLILLLMTVVLSVSNAYIYSDTPWIEITIPLTFSLPDFHPSGGGLEVNFYDDSGFGTGFSLVAGSQSHATFNIIKNLEFPNLEPMAFPLVLRLGWFGEVDEEDDFFGFLGLSLGGGLNYALPDLEKSDAQFHSHLYGETRLDFVHWIKEDFSPEILEFCYFQGVLNLGVSGPRSEGSGSSSGSYTYYTYY